MPINMEVRFCCYSVTQSCPTLCDSMDCSVPGLPVHCQLPEFTESACNTGDLGLIPGLRRSPGEGNGNPLQYSCLENPMDRGALWTTVHRIIKSQT